MTDVTSNVLDELNTIPGLFGRNGLSRLEAARPTILAFCERYSPEDVDAVSAMGPAEIETYLQQLDKRILDFGFDTQEKDILFATVEDTSTNEQIVSLATDTPTPDFETIILEREGDVYPKLIAVSIPNTLDVESISTNGGIPMHIFFHPTIGQNIAEYYTATSVQGRESLKSTLDGNYYPYGWDFLYYIFLRNLTYEANTNIDSNGMLLEWAGKGLLYQIEKSGKIAVNVIPILDASRNAGDFENPELLLGILKEIQQFVTTYKGYEDNGLLPIGYTAVSAFSSGHLCVNKLMQQYNNDTFSEFYQDVLQELYMFDAPQQTNDTWVSLATAWANKYENKIIRAYSQWIPKNVNRLLASGQSPKQGEIILNSDNANFSFAWLNSSFFKGKMTNYGDWQSIHQAIPSIMLVDSL
ncbi:MAG: hypothetical protein DI598_17510, partial [Pseudopedobacter saltans]